jgi:outer membrane protein assembly factor BamB
MDFRPPRLRAIRRVSRRICRGAKSRTETIVLLSLAAVFFLAVTLLGITAIPAAAQIVVQGAADPNAPTEDDPYGVYLPTDRTLSRGMARARERLAEDEYNEALAFLQQILDRDEDTFLDDSLDAETRRGLKASARSLIAGLPSAGREMYQLLHSAEARRELEAAIESGNRDELAKVVRRYFLTPPGYEAAIVLAQLEFDRGHPLTAAHLYDELLADPKAAALFEPQLSMLAAVSWSAAGKPQQAAAKLQALAENYPRAEVEIAGRKVPLPRSNSAEDLLAWLHEAVGLPKSASATDDDWLTQRGDPSRNANHPGGAPHLSARWQSRVVNDPRFENFLSSRQELQEQQGLATIAAARPIAAGNVVLMRTPQNVVALDWQTGKRIWETREEDSNSRDRLLSDFNSGENADEFNQLRHPLEQRVWDDTLTMALSRDGERAFALSGMELSDREQQNALTFGAGFGGQFDPAASPTNRLTAYELATEGKLAWEIDGASATGELAGAFFLGPPVAVDGSLYALAEIRGAVYMLALDPATGKLDWRQQLVGLEQGITLDPERRLNSATPSFGAGILVCPTTAGMVVAIDAIRREFAWVYRYPRQVGDGVIHLRQGWQGRVDPSLPRSNNRWLDNSAVIADGKVLLTPPESNDIHCLDLATGKMLWKKPREKSIYLAAVDDGVALLVGADSVAALRLADGTPAWNMDRVELPAGVMPSGFGYLSDGRYYLPLTSGQVIAVNMKDGEVTGATDSQQDTTVGNLICHRGSVISQSTLYLDKFEQIDVLRERAQQLLAKNPRDAAAIRDLAEIRRLEGDHAEAVKMLKSAHDIDPQDPITRDMLSDALLAALAADYEAHRDDLPLLRKIVFRPQQQIELLRIDALGRDAAGQRLEAFDAYLHLADATANAPALLNVGPKQEARSDQWVRAQVSDLWRAASSEEREQIVRILDERKSKWSNPPTVTELRNYLSHFAGLPGTDEIRLQLARELVSRNEPLEVEIELLRLSESLEPSVRDAASVLMIEWLIAQGRLDEADQLVELDQEYWSTDAEIEGKTPQEWREVWQPKLAAASSQQVNWPRGRVKVEEISPKAANRQTLTRRAQMDMQRGLRRLRLEQINGAPLGPTQWCIAQDNSLLLGHNSLGKEAFRFSVPRNSAMRRFAGNSDMVQAAQLGDLLYVTLGGQVLALDTSERAGRDDTELVWQAYPAGRYPLAIDRKNRRTGKSVYHPWSKRQRLAGAVNLLVGGLGPATPHGIVFQEQQKLRAVDPLSGETLWSRDDVPTGSELFGDSEFVLAANIDDGQLHVIDMVDGELVATRELPETPWILTAGRNIGQLIEEKVDGKSRKVLRVIDGVTGDKLFETDFDASVRMTTIEPNSVVAVEADGTFQLIDVATGGLRIEHKLPLTAAPREVLTLTSGDQLFVAINGPTRSSNSRFIHPADFPLIDGQVFAFDLRDGKPLWPGPALVEQRGLALAQPADIPVLIFVDRMMKRNAGGQGANCRLLAIDKATGATVYRNDDLPDTSGPHLRIQTDVEEAPIVNVEMSTKTIRFTFTDEPRSPEPPSNELVEAPRQSLGRGLWSVTQKVGSALQDALQKRARLKGQIDPADHPDDDD